MAAALLGGKKIMADFQIGETARASRRTPLAHTSERGVQRTR
ncbi:hypothetical protein [Novosphingobium album (ex Liu et al. 2023)]|nr:hypothetical protein [Novosphingobium album (ex Liu et al. 2023)]